MQNGKRSRSNDFRDVNRPNILIVGYTGAGKTSLLQEVFGKGMVPDDCIGHGQPTTSDFTVYETDGIRIYDSQGLEPGKKNGEKTFTSRVEKFVEAIKNKSSVPEQVHMLWYCINGGGSRVTPCDLRLIHSLAKHVIVVITKSDITRPDQYKSIAEDLQKNGVAPANILPCSTFNVTQLKDLRKRTLELAPAAYKTAIRESMRLVPLATYTEHHKQLWAVAFSPDSRHLASGGDDCQVIVRRLEEASNVKQLCRLKNDSEVTCVRFSPDGHFLAYGDDDGFLWLRVLTQTKKSAGVGVSFDTHYDLGRLGRAQSAEVISAKVSDYKCYSIAFHPKKQQLAVATKGNAVVVFAYHYNEGAVIFTLDKLRSFKTDNDVNSLAFSSDGSRLFFVDDDGSLHSVNLEHTKSIRLKWKVSDNYIRTIDTHPSRPIIALAGDDDVIRVFSVEGSKTLLATLERNDEVWSVRFSPCGDLLAFGDGDGKIGIWDWNANKVITERFHGKYDDHVYSVDVSNDGCFIASGSEDKTVRVWDIRGKD